MMETINSKFVKKDNQLKIKFVPSTPEEKKHLQRLKELIYQKRHGDWEEVSNIVGIPTRSVEKAFVRVYSKNHFKTVDALEQVIENRKNHLKQ